MTQGQLDQIRRVEAASANSIDGYSLFAASGEHFFIHDMSRMQRQFSCATSREQRSHNQLIPCYSAFRFDRERSKIDAYDGVLDLHYCTTGLRMCLHLCAR